jgi:predicted dehydrogenase
VTRVAVLGLGAAAQTLHLPALADLAGATVVGGCDPDAARRAEVEDRFGIPTYESFARLVAAAPPEVVIVATRPAAHGAHCGEAFAAGCHVVCEKPLAASVAEADTILAAAEAANRRLAVNHEFRAMPIVRAVRERLGAPGVGRLRFAQVWQAMDLPPWKEPNWRAALATRVLYEAGLHHVDTLLTLFDSAPAAVTATVGSSGARDEASDAVAVVTVEFADGRLGHVVHNRLSPGDTLYFEIRADAEHASLRASFGGRLRLSAGLLRATRPHLRVESGAAGLAWLEQGSRRRRLAANPRAPAMTATRQLLAETLRGFADGTPPPASGDDGRRVLEVIAAAYRSAATGRRVVLAEEREAIATIALAAP